MCLLQLYFASWWLCQLACSQVCLVFLVEQVLWQIYQRRKTFAALEYAFVEQPIVQIREQASHQPSFHQYAFQF
jgi:hypothetical protein